MSWKGSNKKKLGFCKNQIKKNAHTNSQNTLQKKIKKAHNIIHTQK